MFVDVKYLYGSYRSLFWSPNLFVLGMGGVREINLLGHVKFEALILFAVAAIPDFTRILPDLVKMSKILAYIFVTLDLELSLYQVSL